MEAQCKNPTSRAVLVTQYDAFVAQAAALVQAIQVTVVEPENLSTAASMSITSVDYEQNKRHVHNLMQLLEDSDTQAQNYLQDHAEALRSILGDNWKVVMSHVQNFDFDQALNALKHSAI